MVPSDSVTIPLTVQPGDTVFASVTVVGRSVRVAIADRTTGATFTRTLHPSVLDTTSADWIAEAPSTCFGSSTCVVEPLANFGSVSFASARATSTTGHAGPISDSAWSATVIDMAADAGPPGFRPGDRFAGALGLKEATTGPLSASGDGFAVTVAGASPST
jgi:hypothetical protein